MTLTEGSAGAERERTAAVAVDQTASTRAPPRRTCARLEVDPAAGLDDAEVRRRRAQVGPNKLAEVKKEPGWHAFLRQYRVGHLPPRPARVPS